MIKEVDVKTLQECLNVKKDFQLIDVREPHEKEIADIGGVLIPVGTLEANLDKINKEKSIVVYCRSGVRSAKAVQLIEEKLGVSEVYNLKGGILAWADEIDPTVQKY